MDTRSDNDIVIEYTVRLEKILRNQFGATGTGLGTLISSLAAQLPESLIKEGRRLAAIRNRVVHEHVPLENRSDYIRRCERLEKKLLALVDKQEKHTPAKSWWKPDLKSFNQRFVINPNQKFLSFWLGDRFYWPLVAFAFLFSFFHVNKGLSSYDPWVTISTFFKALPEYFLFASMMNFSVVLFLKNIGYMTKYIPGIPGWISAAFLAAVTSPLMLAKMMVAPFVFGTVIAAYVLGSTLFPAAFPSGNSVLDNYIASDFADAAAISLALQPFILGFMTAVYYGLSFFYRRVRHEASGHAATAIIFVAFGYLASDVHPLWLIPLIWLAAVDLWKVGQEEKLLAWPKDIMRQVIARIPAARRDQQAQRERRPATQNGASGEYDPIRSPFLAEIPRYNFSHVVGMHELKNRLGSAGREILQAWRNGVSARNGILLYGPPGTGKTFFAEALAGELRLNIIKANLGHTASRWVNQTTEQVLAVFREAEQQAPVVLFIDEIDALLIDRSKASNADSEAARLVSAFLPAIERLRSRGVVVIGATNLMDQLDPAAIREGRFDFKIEVPYPDDEARVAILKERVIKTGVIVHLETLKRLSKRWSGFSVARLHAIVDEVARMDTGDVATFDDFMAALRKVQGRKGARGEGGPTLDQLSLSLRLREELTDIANRMKNIEAIERLGGSLPRGILFFGPPGTGKTYTARALANTADWAFIATTGHDLLAAPQKIDEIMRQASDLRPCIVFIDEADDVFGHRGFSQAPSITNKLLSALDGAQGQVPDVLIIAATNHPDNIDPAALRGGRFTEKIEFELPDHTTLHDHIQRWLHSAKVAIHDEVSVAWIAELVVGHPLATVNEILRSAVNRMASRVATQGDHVAHITTEDIRVGIRRVVGEVPL